MHWITNDPQAKICNAVEDNQNQIFYTDQTDGELVEVKPDIRFKYVFGK